MCQSIFGGVVITFIGLIFASNFSILVDKGNFAQEAIFALLLYLLLVVSILGLRILSKLNDRRREDDSNRDANL